MILQQGTFFNSLLKTPELFLHNIKKIVSELLPFFAFLLVYNDKISQI